MSPLETENRVLEKWRSLPPDRQMEALDFMDFLRTRSGATRPRKSSLGLLAHLNVHISDADIEEARREMWGNFPRDVEL